ncbi:MAG TPA: NADH dehydrogenase FAD-containing subunit, partial [Myxococcales bacterium]|nr:NADH dehydrogenase FAD-containing subunit [Myxococcales bacterium]
RQQLWLLVGTASAHLALTASFWLFRPSSVGFFLSLDALGLLFLSLMSALFLAASIYSVSYLRAHAEDDVAIDRYVPFLLWFLAAMTLVTVTQHLALMWAAVEATTLASAPLIYFHRRRAALEAAWKYLLICSVG